MTKDSSDAHRMTEGEVLCERFTLIRALDREGASQIWLAEDSELLERVALRILDPASGRRHQELMRLVCRKVRRLRHSHIVPVFDFYREREICFLSREYVEGGGLDSLQGLAAPRLAEEFAPAVEALACAHRAGVVHGDLKSSKLLVDASGNVRIADFELGAVLHERLHPDRAAGADVAHQEQADRSALASLWLELLGPDEEVDRSLLEHARLAPEAIETFEPLLRGGAPLSRDAPDRARHAGRDVLVPVELGRRTRTPLADDARKRNQRIAVGGGVLAALLIVVLFVLPRWVEPEEAFENPGSASETPAPAPHVSTGGATQQSAQAGASDATQADVQRLLGQILNRRQALTERGAEVWATDDTAALDERIANGEQAQVASDFDEAASHYGLAADMAEALETRAEEVLAQALEAGSAALGARDVPEAVLQFELAALADPGNEDAGRGLHRAEALQKVLTLTATGEQLEQEVELERARDAFEAALQLDAAWELAKNGLERVEGVLHIAAYQREVALAVSALARKDLGSADEHVRAALELEPSSADARDLARRIAQKRLAVAVAAGRRRAEAHEAKEQWREATGEYRKLLDRDPDLAFAREGFQQSEWRASVSERFSAWIARPALLFDDATRAEARETLRKARDIPDPGPQLRYQIAEVADIESVASMPMHIVFESDGLTEVQISRVGGLGTFARREVSLKPGRYVVRGIRRGFRDVRQTVDVIPGRVPPTVDVRCVEEI